MRSTVGQPRLLRAINLRAAFDLVSADGPVPATSIVQGTGLSKPTVSEVLRQLLDLELITKAGRTSGQVGPSAQLYGVNPLGGWVLGIDVGRQFVRAVAADLSGRVIAEANERARHRSARQMVEQIEHLAAEVGKRAGAPCHLVVVGTPGVLRPNGTHLELAPQLPGWERPAVIDELRARLPGPLVFENDVNLAAIGELSRGAGQGVRNFVLISIGTGLGMAVVLNGALHRGASGLAGEIGYLPTSPLDGIATLHSSARGHTGSSERLLSSQAVMELARDTGLGSMASAAMVIDAAREGDPAATRVVDAIAARLAHVIASVSAVLDPELVLLGGGIGTGAAPILLDPTRRAMAALSPFRPRLAVSELGSRAVLDGAVTEGLRLVLGEIFGPDGSETRSAS